MTSVVRAERILAHVPSDELDDSVVMGRIVKASDAAAARLRAARLVEAHREEGRLLELLHARAVRAARRDASRLEHAHDRLAALDATVSRCPIDGAWVVEGRPCSCCSSRLPS